MEVGDDIRTSPFYATETRSIRSQIRLIPHTPLHVGRESGEILTLSKAGKVIF